MDWFSSSYRCTQTGVFLHVFFFIRVDTDPTVQHEAEDYLTNLQMNDPVNTDWSGKLLSDNRRKQETRWRHTTNFCSLENKMHMPDIRK